MIVHDVCFVELATRDTARAQAFFAAVFDWKFVANSPAAVLVDAGEDPAAALVPIALGERRVPGARAHLQVEDCAAIARRAEELGGRVVAAKEPSRFGGHRTLVIDPWDNELGFLEAPLDRPRARASPTHSFRGLELAVTSAEEASAYYQRLLGWEFTPVDRIARHARLLSRGPMVVSVRGADPDTTRRGTLIFVGVDDLPLRIERVERAGGRVVFGPHEVPGEGSYAIVVDPEGSPLALMRNA